MILRQLCKEQRGDTRIARKGANVNFATEHSPVEEKSATHIATVKEH